MIWRDALVDVLSVLVLSFVYSQLNQLLFIAGALEKKLKTLNLRIRLVPMFKVVKLLSLSLFENSFGVKTSFVPIKASTNQYNDN